MRRSRVRTRGSTSSSNHTTSAARIRSNEWSPETEEPGGRFRNVRVRELWSKLQNVQPLCVHETLKARLHPNAAQMPNSALKSSASNINATPSYCLNQSFTKGCCGCRDLGVTMHYFTSFPQVRNNTKPTSYQPSPAGRCLRVHTPQPKAIVLPLGPMHRGGSAAPTPER